MYKAVSLDPFLALHALKACMQEVVLLGEGELQKVSRGRNIIPYVGLRVVTVWNGKRFREIFSLVFPVVNPQTTV